MCFGNDDPPQMQQIPNPPPEKEMMDFISYITGTQTVTVTGANGRKQRITTRLPTTPEEQAALDAGQDLLITSLQQIKELYKYNPQSVISFAPLVNTLADLDDERLKDIGEIANFGNTEQEKQMFKDMQRTLIDEQFYMRERANEEHLAHSGRGSGTYAAESRAAMARAHGLARMEGDAKAQAYAEDLAAQRLGTNKQAFGLRELGRQGTLDAAQTEYALKKADEQDQEARRQQAIQERTNQFNVGSNVLRYNDWRALQDKTHENSLNTYLAENNVQNTRYGHQVNAIAANNQMAMQEYANRPPSFGEIAANFVSNGVGRILSSPDNTVAGRIGKKFLG